MALGNLYVDAYQQVLGLAEGRIVNWPPTNPVDLGDVGSLVTDFETGIVAFQYGSSLADLEIGFTVQPSGVLGDLSLTSGVDTAIEFGFDATTPGWEWLGDASAGVHASFGTAGGLQAQAEGLREMQIANIDSLKTILLQAYHDGKLSMGSAIVVEKQTADLGMVVASVSSAGDLKIAATADVAPGGAPLAKFAAGFNLKSAAGGAVTQPMSARSTLNYRVLIVGTRGFWWWKYVVVDGAANLSDSDRLNAIENSLGDDEFYVTY